MVVERDNDRSIQKRPSNEDHLTMGDLLSFALFPLLCNFAKFAQAFLRGTRIKTPSLEAVVIIRHSREYFSFSSNQSKFLSLSLSQIVAISSISANETTNVPFENYSRLRSQFLRFGSFPPRDSRVISYTKGETCWMLEKKSR